MESLSCGKMNLISTGKSGHFFNCVPRHSAGMARQLSFRVRLAYGPLTTLQSKPVSQASPSGSDKFVFSGNRGASERAPHGRGLKIGSILEITGVTPAGVDKPREDKAGLEDSGCDSSGLLRTGSATVHDATSTRAKKFSRRRNPSSIRSMEVAYEIRK